MSIFDPDPENDPQEEAELTYRLQQAVHEFEPGANGKCIAEVERYCYTHETVDWHNPCNADRWSVLHIDDYADRHDHGGFDCMCFEGRQYEYGS